MQVASKNLTVRECNLVEFFFVEALKIILKKLPKVEVQLCMAGVFSNSCIYVRIEVLRCSLLRINIILLFILVDWLLAIRGTGRGSYNELGVRGVRFRDWFGANRVVDSMQRCGDQKIGCN